jgi:hypothetical protein
MFLRSTTNFDAESPRRTKLGDAIFRICPREPQHSTRSRLLMINLTITQREFMRLPVTKPGGASWAAVVGRDSRPDNPIGAEASDRDRW